MTLSIIHRISFRRLLTNQLPSLFLERQSVTDAYYYASSRMVSAEQG